MGGIPSVQWGGYLQYSGGITSVQWGDNISTVEVAQYSGDKDLKYYEFSKNLKESRNLFQSLFRFEIRSATSQDSIKLLTTADMVKDLGYKNLVLGKILL